MKFFTHDHRYLFALGVRVTIFYLEEHQDFAEHPHSDIIHQNFIESDQEEIEKIVDVFELDHIKFKKFQNVIEIYQ